MANSLEHLLAKWLPQKDSCQWVLATIVETKRSAYRKAGAMMLINSFGKSLGLLSGGCLEADLMRQAQKCWLDNANHFVCYDMQDDSDISWQLGIGCGGMVKVLLQPVSAANQYLQLPVIYQNLQSHQAIYYQQNLASKWPENKALHGRLVQQVDTDCFISYIKPQPALVIFGGGIDAQPLVKLANVLGWHCTLIDSRVSYARPVSFSQAEQIIKLPYQQLKDNRWLTKADAIVIMHHNLTLDAEALMLTRYSQAEYIGILGPAHRTSRVLKAANLLPEQLNQPLFSPMGLDLGGELPESIAISIIAQIHACLEQGSAQSLNQPLLTDITTIEQERENVC